MEHYVFSFYRVSDISFKVSVSMPVNNTPIQLTYSVNLIVPTLIVNGSNGYSTIIYFVMKVNYHNLDIIHSILVKKSENESLYWLLCQLTSLLTVYVD